jgi:N-acetylneuraminic acid mutarotase
MSNSAALRRAILALLVVAGAAAAPPAFAQQQAATWSMAPPLPQPRNELQAITVGNKIYLAGGAWTEMKDGKEIDHYTEGFMTEYDPQANTWRERAKGPEGLTHQGIATWNGKIYLAGGFAEGRHQASSANVYSYDPATDKYQALAPLSGKRGAVALAVVGGKIHAIGGRVMGEEATLATHEVYDPATNKWTAAAPLPTARDHVGIFVVNGNIHVIGGRTTDANSNVALHDVYDPATDKWTSAAPMPTPRSSGAFADYRGMLFIAGGECQMRKSYEQVEAYDSRNERWVTFPALPSARHGFAAASAGDKLFFFGGSLGCGGGGKVADNLILTLR